MKHSVASQAPARHDRRISEHIHDPYATRRKVREPAVCPDCGAILKAGRWSWGRRPGGAHAETCPACRRVADAYPAGELVISGAFVQDHKEEILNLAHNTETTEKAEHPLHRMMYVADRPGAITVTTTDLHLPRRIGEALHNAYEGELHIDYDTDGYFVRCRWHRED